MLRDLSPTKSELASAWEWVLDNLGLVGDAASRFDLPLVEDRQDAFQDGTLGLLRAALTYDVRPRTYPKSTFGWNLAFNAIKVGRRRHKRSSDQLLDDLASWDDRGMDRLLSVRDPDPVVDLIDLVRAISEDTARMLEETSKANNRNPALDHDLVLILLTGEEGAASRLAEAHGVSRQSISVRKKRILPVLQAASKKHLQDS